MPIFMDRHHLPSATHQDVEQAHKLDLEVQKERDVKVLTYWFDPKDGLAFCLVDAPTQEALAYVHQKAHGNVPTEIIEVKLEDVEALLGRTADPEPIKLPSGEIQPSQVDAPLRAILFTDLKDSTQLTMELGDLKAIELLEKHDQMIRNALLAHHGREVKHTGDGIMASFTSVADAIHCAIDVQKAFSAYNSQISEKPLHVRIGINAGLPVERSGDLFGSTVQLAARICNHAQPDQVLVSAIMRELCHDETLASQFVDAGRASMKGFVSAVQLYEVKWID